MADINEEVRGAVSALREEIIKTVPSKETLERVNAVLDAHEDQNSKLVAAENKLEAQADEVKEMKEKIEASSSTQQEARDRVDQLEVAIARASEKARVDADYKESAEYQALNQHAINGIQTETLRTDVNVSGGFLVPSELDNAIIKEITELDDVRGSARVRTLSGKSLDVPKRTSIPVATFEGEAEAGGNSASQYALQSLTPFRQTFSTQITQDMLNDSAFDMESEMSSDAALAFANGAGQNYVTGDGVKKPYGFMVDADVLANSRNSLDANEITFDGIVRITGDLKSGYAGKFFFNRSTLASVRALVSTTGQPLWEPGLNGLVASTLSGHPYVVLPTMPDEGAGTYPVAFGDLRAAYTIADRTGMSVVRDDVTLKKQAIIEFTWNRWTTGDVVLAEALRVLKCSV